VRTTTDNFRKWRWGTIWFSALIVLLSVSSVLRAQEGSETELRNSPIRAIFWNNSVKGQVCLLMFREDYTLVGYVMKSAKQPTQKVFLKNGEMAKVFISVVINPIDITLKSVDYGYAILISDGKGKAVMPKKLGTIISTYNNGSYVGCVIVDRTQTAQYLFENFETLTSGQLKEMASSGVLLAESVVHDQADSINLP